MAKEQYDAMLIQENEDRETINVYVPAIQVEIRNVKVSRTQGIEYKYSRNTLFNVSITRELLESASSGAKIIDGTAYRIVAYEDKQPSPNVKRTPLKPAIRSFEGIGDILQEELQYCVTNIQQYVDKVGKVLAQSTGSPREKRLSENQPKPGELRFAPPFSDTEAQKADDNTTTTGSMTISRSNGTEIQSGNGKGIEVGNRGTTVQGTFKQPNPLKHSPISPSGIDAMTFPAFDCVPKGNVCTPHTSKLPDILGYVSMGIGIYNVLTVIRSLYGIESKWKQVGNGYEAQADSLLQEMQDKANKAGEAMNSALNAPASESSKSADPFASKLRKVKAAFGLLSPGDIIALGKGEYFKEGDNVLGVDLYGAPSIGKIIEENIG